jgi:hypothetical protein
MRRAELVAAMLGMNPDFFNLDGRFRRVVRKLDAKHCIECGTDIPPGRPGRKCKTCREKKPGETICVTL